MVDDTSDFADAAALISRRLETCRSDDPVRRFVSALETANMPPGGLTRVDLAGVPVTTPRLADDAVGGSELVGEMRRSVPSVVDGPVDRGAQQWIAVARPSWRPPRRQLSIRYFAAPVAGLLTDRPQFGLFTSTRAWNGTSMWRVLLETTDSPTLYPRPWFVWEGEVAGPVREVCTAGDWATLVTEFPLESGNILFPDWASIAKSYAGVHLTAAAVAATQGIWLRHEHATVTATFWTVESTLWLRWPFARQRLAATVE